MLFRLKYGLVKSILYLYSLVPLPILYVQSSLTAWFLQRVIGYRKGVVLDNLRHAFPEKSEAEIKTIATGFYQNFCDVFVEMLKMLSMSSANLKKRVRHLNPEIIPDMVADGKGGIAIFGHYGNWEWLGAGMGLQLPFDTVGVYKPLSSKVFDQLTLHIRTRFGNDMITMKETYRESLTRLKKPCYIAFLGDQTPSRHGNMYFTQFMGRPAPVHLGIATIALKMQRPLWYFDIRRERRGYYTVQLREVQTTDLLPYSKENSYKLTDRHVSMLEEIIREEPSRWLWSHRRWKHKPTVEDIISP